MNSMENTGRKFFFLPLLVTFLTLTPIAATPPSQAQEPKPNANAISSSTKSSAETKSGKIYAVEKTVINAPPQAVWKVLTDYANAADVFPYLEKCEVIEDLGATKLVTHVIRPTTMFAPFEYVLELKETPPYLLEFKRVRGAFKHNSGYWKLEPLDEGKQTHVTFAKYLDTGLFVPQIMVRRLLASEMPPVLKALKAEAESGAKSAQAVTN